MKVIRSILAVLAGIAIAGAMIFAAEAAGQKLYPLPPGVDPRDVGALRAVISTLPAGAFVMVLIGWAAGTFAGGFLAAFIARRAPNFHALIVGGIMMAGAIATMIELPHPVWVWIVGLLLFVPAALLGASLVRRKGAAAARTS